MTRLRTPLGASLLVASVLVAPLGAGEREVRTVELSAATIRELAGVKLGSIPQILMRDAAGVAIIPGVVKAGFVVDARIGHGVVMSRQPDGCWSNPVFITLGGVGIGWQAGVESTDVVLVFRTAHSLDRFLKGKGKLTLGGDVSVAIGPVGREAEAATDARLRAEIFSYSRSRGLFAGVSVQGAVLRVNPRANEAFYDLRGGRPVRALAAHEVAAVEGPATTLNCSPGGPIAGRTAAAPAGRPAVCAAAAPARRPAVSSAGASVGRAGISAAASAGAPGSAAPRAVSCAVSWCRHECSDCAGRAASREGPALQISRRASASFADRRVP